MFVRKADWDSAQTELDGLRFDLHELQEATEARATEDARTWLASVLKKRIVVHHMNDQSIRGSLSEIMADGIVLRAAEWLNPGGTSTSMAGEIFIPREKVAFTQLDE